MTTNNYGAVVSHIEPEHPNTIPIPDPPVHLKQCIHNHIMESFQLRDQSNERMDEAQSRLQAALQLPAIAAFRSMLGPQILLLHTVT